MTLKEIRDYVIAENNILGHPEFPSQRVDKIINLAQRDVQLKLPNLDKFEAIVTISSLTAAAFVSASNNVKTFLTSSLTNLLEREDAIRFIECSYDSDETKKGLAYEISESEFKEKIKNTYLIPTMLEPKFARINNKIYLSPSTVTSCIAHYYKRVTDLVSDSDSTEIPLEFEKMILDIAGVFIKIILGVPAEAK